MFEGAEKVSPPTEVSIMAWARRRELNFRTIRIITSFWRVVDAIAEQQSSALLFAAYMWSRRAGE